MNSFKIKKLYRGILTICLYTPLISYGPEYIKEFNSDIVIHTDGSMDVTETIVYINKNLPNKHGIFRDFPTSYKGPYGSNYTITFKVKNVLRNGVPELYTVKTIPGGKRISTGDDTVIPPGTSTYTITYYTHRQLGFLKDYDMLYWNVTGNNWPWIIEKATATIHLPKTIPIKSLRIHGFTGSMYQEGTAYYSQKNDNNSITFQTTEPLSIENGFSIQVSWPKGFVTPPTRWEEFRDTFYDNAALIITLLSIILILIWYIVWWRIMRRRENRLGGPIIPLFAPPAQMSPGEIQYILEMSYDAKQFAAEVVDMAVKGLIVIDCKTGWLSNSYSLSKKRDVNPIRDSALHQSIMQTLFAQNTTLELSEKNKSILKKTGTLIEKKFEGHENSLFLKHGTLTIIPIFISMASIGVVLFFGTDFFGPILVIFVMLHAIGAYLVKSYTPDGCKIKHQILGFKLFLATTESDRMNILGTPPTKTPDLYEKYLPYALALGVEKQWSKKFATVFYELEKKGIHYAPVWYHGDTFNAGNFTTFDATSFASTLSSSLQSAARSSGAGGFGNGGSGGGRGGGGGGSR